MQQTADKLTIPYNLYTPDSEVIDLVTECVSFIKINKKEYNLSLLTPSERKTIINN